MRLGEVWVAMPTSKNADETLVGNVTDLISTVLRD